MVESVFDAMDKALAEVSAGAPDTNIEDADDTSANASASVEGADQGDDLDLEGAESGTEGTEGAEGAAGAGELGPDGKPKPVEGDGKDAKGEQRGVDKPGEKKPEIGADGKPVVKADDKSKKPDPVNDPIPTNVSQPTQERMRTLVKMTKELTTERDSVNSTLNDIVGGVQRTGMTPSQYGEVLGFMTLFNSGDTEQQTKALELIEDMCDRLAATLGKERTIKDPLEAFPDLKTAVAQGQMTAQWAKQMAVARRQSGIRTQVETQSREQQQQQQTVKQERDSAEIAMNNWEAQTAAGDPDFAKIKAALVPILKPIITQLPPSQWLPKFKEAYELRKAQFVAAAKARAARGGVPANQALRGKTPAGGGSGTGAPKSLAEAINAGIAAAGKR